MNRRQPHLTEAPRRYEELVAMLPLRPIRDDADYSKAMHMISCLAGLPRMTRDQSDYLDVLSNEVERYEQQHEPIDASDLTPLDTLKFLLDENGMSASDLGRLLGSRQLGSAILRGHRSLSKSHIAVLAEYFHVEPGLFLEKPARRNVA